MVQPMTGGHRLSQQLAQYGRASYWRTPWPHDWCTLTTENLSKQECRLAAAFRRLEPAQQQVLSGTR
jgi:hypothetical protein